jgi:hypothetical protein
MQCGGALPDVGTCRDGLRDLVDARGEDAIESRLAIACYTLQHPDEQSERALRWARFQLEGTLSEGGRFAIQQRAMRNLEVAIESDARPEPDARRVLQWKMTLTDVISPDDGSQSGLLDRIEAWARACRDDLNKRPPPAAEG